MHLRQLKKVDYKALNSGEESDSEFTMDKGQQEDIFGNALDKQVDPNAKDDDSDSDSSETTVVTPEELKELREELAQLDLQEERLKLKKTVSEKRASIQLMKQEMKAKGSSHTPALPGNGKMPPYKPPYQYDEMRFGLGDKQQPIPPSSSYQFPGYPAPVMTSPYGSQPVPSAYGQASRGYQYEPPSSNPHEMRMDLDPQSYLRVATASAARSNKKGQYRAIVDFIPKSGKRKREEDEIDLGEIIMTMKSSPRPKIENVSPSQWVSANALILHDMIENDYSGANITQLVVDYLSYQCKIGELAVRYTWSSVMMYDDEYREKQHLLGFRWGCDSPHVAQTNLVERPKPQTNKKEQKGEKLATRKPRKQLSVCTFYNEGTCTREKCTFPHICAKCGKDHPEFDHEDSASGRPYTSRFKKGASANTD